MSKNEPVQHYAHYAEDGSILGLYNSRRHNKIPEPYVTISEDIRDKIVGAPMSYKIDATLAALVRRDAPAKPKLVEGVSEASIIARGVEIDGIYYAADDRASAHVTQCLALADLADTETFMVKGIESGVPAMLPVDKPTLIRIGVAINDLRATAMSIHMQQQAPYYN